MKMHSVNWTVKVIRTDLAKNSLQVYCVDENGRWVVGKKFSRRKDKAYLVNLSVRAVAMEACASAYYWARLLTSYGHEVKLIAQSRHRSPLEPLTS